MPALLTSAPQPNGGLASFQIGGAQKCGTNAVFNGLFGDPRICLSQRKEIRFFLDDRNFTDQSSKQEIAREYARYFPDWSRNQVAGEGTPEYMYNAKAIERIHRYNPSTKWIICLRNPVVRAFSQWKMMLRNGFDERPFDRALLDALEACAKYRRGSSSEPRDRGGLLSRGFYVEQLQRLFALFGRDRVCVLFTPNLRLLFGLTVSTAQRFILEGHNPKRLMPPISYHHYFPAALPEESLERLSNFYASEIHELADLLGCDLSGWLDQPLSD